MDRRIAPSTRIEEAIEAVLLDGISGPDQLSQLGRLDAQLILQRAVEEEVAIFLGRSRYERTPDAAGSRNGTRLASSTSWATRPESSPAIPASWRCSRRAISDAVPYLSTVVEGRPGGTGLYFIDVGTNDLRLLD